MISFLLQEGPLTFQMTALDLNDGTRFEVSRIYALKT